MQYRIYGHKGNTGHKTFLAPNPPDGALLTYWLKAKPGEKDEVKITIKDAAGEARPRAQGLEGRGPEPDELGPAPRAAGEAGAGAAGGSSGHRAARSSRPGPTPSPSRWAASSASRTLAVQEDPRLEASRGRSPGLVRGGARGRQAVDAGRRAQQDPGVAPEAAGGAPGLVEEGRREAGRGRHGGGEGARRQGRAAREAGSAARPRSASRARHWRPTRSRCWAARAVRISRRAPSPRRPRPSSAPRSRGSRRTWTR